MKYTRRNKTFQLFLTHDFCTVATLKTGNKDINNQSFNIEARQDIFKRNSQNFTFFI